MNQAYVFAGIDKAVVIAQSIKKSHDNDILIHMHSRDTSCTKYKHVGYSAGKMVSEYGEVDGSGTTGALAHGRLPAGPALGD